MLPSDTLCIIYSYLRVKQVLYSCTSVNTHWSSAVDLYFESRFSVLDVEKEVSFDPIYHQRSLLSSLSSSKIPTKQKKENNNFDKKKKNGEKRSKNKKVSGGKVDDGVTLSYKLTTDEQDHERQQRLKSLLHCLLHREKLRAVERFVLRSDCATRENCMDQFPVSFWSTVREIVIGPCRKLCQRKWFAFMMSNIITGGLETLDLTIPDMQHQKLSMLDLMTIILKNKHSLRRLALRGRIPIDSHMIQKCVARCTHLTSLSLENAGDCSTRSLERLTIGHMHERSVMESLGQVSCPCPQLKHLHLLQCNLDAKVMHTVFKSSLGPRLTSLSLETCESRVVGDILPSIFELLTGLTTLRIVDRTVHWCHVRKAVMGTGSPPITNHPLRKLVLLTQENTVDRELLRELKQSCLTQLRILKVNRSCSLITDSEFEVIQRTQKTVTYCLS